MLDSSHETSQYSYCGFVSRSGSRNTTKHYFSLGIWLIYSRFRLNKSMSHSCFGHICEKRYKIKKVSILIQSNYMDKCHYEFQFWHRPQTAIKTHKNTAQKSHCLTSLIIAKKKGDLYLKKLGESCSRSIENFAILRHSHGPFVSSSGFRQKFRLKFLPLAFRGWNLL